ncbi:MAG: FCD domain-containing protein [Bacillota bacterium]
MEQFDNLTLLSEIKQASGPVGASYLSEVLSVPQATIGRRLKLMEEEGYLEKVDNKGRRLTVQGMSYYEEKVQLANKKVSIDKLFGLMENVTKKTLLEIIEVRRTLEGLTVALACEKITDKQMSELDAIMLAYAIEARYGGSGSELDLKFHLSIAEYSGNYTLYQILKILLMTDDVYVKFFSMAKALEKGQICVTQHDEIMQAIKERDPVKAKLAMERHLDKVTVDIEQYCNL